MRFFTYHYSLYLCPAFSLISSFVHTGFLLSLYFTFPSLSWHVPILSCSASASIISRGSRSLGYGFVEMESEEEARKSVELLNKKVIDNREINVEIARPREEKPAPAEGAPAAAAGAQGDVRYVSYKHYFSSTFPNTDLRCTQRFWPWWTPPNPRTPPKEGTQARGCPL
jgi:RNA recognition motif-containing protein